MTAQLEGIGMTSRRTRMRLVQRLREGGIESDRVLDVIGQVPRHIFLDEALSVSSQSLQIKASEGEGIKFSNQKHY